MTISPSYILIKDKYKDLKNLKLIDEAMREYAELRIKDYLRKYVNNENTNRNNKT